MERKTVRVLLTGFEPFGKTKKQYNMNRSWEIAKMFKGRTIQALNMVVVIDVILLPVEYDPAFKILTSLYDEKEKIGEMYDYIIHMGEGNPSKIKVEHLARSETYVSPGNGGAKDLPLNGKVPNSFEKSISSNCNISEMVKHIHLEYVESSWNAGLYLCEFVYYTSLMSANNSRRTIFIHLPPYGCEITDDDIVDVLNKAVLFLANN
ncbi:Pyroglutamyl-peptidase 1 [Zancudomyces culisetae]|uniref:Pyroglutamyl-peptidase 1 n=1 Tax=Zancudomyces culisetae TaxID=1213189 RepID=A0A1R1PEW3_ZANCU|nr:Pyroglutamyl-peptidase 1 [Zancudomyces culisetae]|eukprot:OMH79469.1 Pyroglutamyl-peptidase 1 [Zancudomyces culisetae]